MAKTEVQVTPLRNYDRLDFTKEVSSFEESKVALNDLIREAREAGYEDAKVEVILHYKTSQSERGSEEFVREPERYFSTGAGDWDKIAYEAENYVIDYLADLPERIARQYRYAVPTGVTVTVFVKVAKGFK
jgi:hypothetical protein